MRALDRPILHWCIVAAVAAAAAVLLTVDWGVPLNVREFRNAVTAFVLLGIVAEAGFLRIGAVGSTSSVAFIPFLAGVVLFPTAWAILVAGVSYFVADAFVRRKPAIKVLYNVSCEILAIWAASSVYQLLGGQSTLVGFRPTAVPFLAGALVYFIVNQSTTVLAVSLSTAKSVPEVWRRLVGSSLVYDVVTGPIAILLAWLYVRLDLIGVLIIVVPVFLVRQIYQINLRLEQANSDLLELMVKAIEARDSYTSGHSVRVSRIARAMATDLGLGARQVELISTAALLHDVGKIYEEFAALLRKEGKLLPHERRIMRTHPVRSAELVATISTLRGAVEAAVRHHHERFDGSGYPDGLVGNDIPIGSRIIAIADTVDAMTTDRPYRPALPYQCVTAELQSLGGRQFDPELVELFCTSSRIQAVVDVHLQRVGDPRPKTVADTFADLRKAIVGQDAHGTPSPAEYRWRSTTADRLPKS